MTPPSDAEAVARADRSALVVAAVIYVSGLTLVATSRPAERPPTPPVAAAATAPSTSPSVDVPQRAPFARHSIALTLPAGRGTEFKYRLEKGAGFVYAWQATGPVTFEFHGDPDGAAPGYADTYRTGEDRTGAGSFTAPATGIHGWYWANSGTSPVTVTLTAAGFFTEAIELGPGGSVTHAIER